MARKLSASKSADANQSGASASPAGPRIPAIPFLDISAKTSWNAAISDPSQALSALMQLFLDEKKLGFTRADLARRLGKRPEQVTRWLAGPGNLKIDTLSDLLLAMGHELVIEVRPIDNRLRADPETEPVTQRHRRSSP